VTLAEHGVIAESTPQVAAVVVACLMVMVRSVSGAAMYLVLRPARQRQAGVRSSDMHETVVAHRPISQYRALSVTMRCAGSRLPDLPVTLELRGTRLLLGIRANRGK
jgi:hypothetical protein